MKSKSVFLRKVSDFYPKEECGIFGIYGNEEAANFTYLGLYALQHRGQESAGIVSTDGERLYRYAGMGQVAHVFDEAKIKMLIGHAAIGHNRYSTTGASFLRNAQPIRVDSRLGSFALAHNGNIVNAWEIRKKLESEGSIFQTTVDTEIIFHLMAKSRKQDFLEALVFALKEIRGAYSLLVLNPNELYAIRDPYGFRPLVMGKHKSGAIAFASETCAFDITEIDYIRDVEPGEIIRVTEKGMESFFPFSKVERQALCIFENIYFSRPDSFIFNRAVFDVRKNLGRFLALEHPANADIVTGVPDSSIVAAIGYAEQSGIPYTTALIRSHYIGRTFIEPEQRIRDFGAKIKYNVVKSVVNGKRVVVVDDSIMRGTTSRKLIKMLRNAGAKEIHLRISAPPTRFPCFYGIDIPTRSELIASTHTIEEIKKYLRVDSLGYLSIEMALKAMETENSLLSQWCDACFTGNYPVPIFEEDYNNQKKLFSEYLLEEMK
ncbi:MAG: amidophosphoribosyltransferase [Leptospiraceae bacterium]|nr:amidophosphoribosyltransferase [Leptospiraceae bacterium]MDW7975242.1 amidophosphoribosyltransferase [Leptospiraceae bacterium]